MRERGVDQEVVFTVERPKSPWWRWPEDRYTGRVPWFVIARRLLFWLPLATGLVLAYLAIIGGYGKKEADKWLRNSI